MDISQYRSLLTEIYSQQNPAEFSKEKLYGSFESLQKVMASQNPAELPIGLQYDIAALPVFSSLKFSPPITVIIAELDPSKAVSSAYPGSPFPVSI